MSEEQRSQPGCTAARMQPEFRHGLLASLHRRRDGIAHGRVAATGAAGCTGSDVVKNLVPSRLR